MRPLAVLLAALTLTSGLAACSGERQTREGNPGVDDERLDQRRQPPDATGGNAPPTTE